MNANTFSKFAVTVLALGLAGCGTLGGDFIKIGDQFVKFVSEKLNPNRPLPPQPQVSAEVRAELAAKPLQQIPIYIGKIVYYDATMYVGRKEGNFNFTKELPQIQNPSADTVAVASAFVKVLNKRLQESSFKVANELCSKCLRLDIDFAIFVNGPDTWTPVNVILSRIRAFYGDIEILETRDDRLAFGKKAPIGPKEMGILVAQELAAIAAMEELVQAWTIAIRGQQVAAAQ